MTTSVKEHLQTELQQAQTESKQRASRIGDILKVAASMTFEEIKAGSSELNVSTRKSVAEILEDLQEAPVTTTHVVTDEVSSVADASAETEDNSSAAETVVPTWKTILQNALTVVRDRKGDWFQAFRKSVNNNAAKFDHDMTDEYGDLYLKARNFFQRVIEQLKSQSANPETESTATSQPVTIEVVDGDAPVIDVTPTVQLTDTEVSR